MRADTAANTKLPIMEINISQIAIIVIFSNVERFFFFIKSDAAFQNTFISVTKLCLKFNHYM